MTEVSQKQVTQATSKSRMQPTGALRNSRAKRFTDFVNAQEMIILDWVRENYNQKGMDIFFAAYLFL